jgi:hypothetical protein
MDHRKDLQFFSATHRTERDSSIDMGGAQTAAETTDRYIPFCSLFGNVTAAKTG